MVLPFAGLAIGALSDAEVVTKGATVNTLKFIASILCSEDALTDLGVDLLINALMIAVLTGIGIGAFADVSAAAFESRPRALSSCGHFSQTCMPSYHV